MSDKILDELIKALTNEKIDASFLSDDSSPCVVAGFMSTGCLALDLAMGGGFPLGRVVEIYGDTSTGKSLIAAQACSTAQHNGGVAVYIDTETSVSLPIMEAVGVDVDSLIYLAPDTVESVFKAMETVIDKKPEDRDMVVVWDSVAATSSKAEMEGSTGDVGYLTHSRVISQGLRRLTRMVAKMDVSLLFLNQAKERIGVLFGDRVATFGGKAVGFHSSVRIQLSVTKKLKTGKRVAGILVRAKVTKNKVARPFREVDLPIYFGQGIDDAEASLLTLKASGLITVKGNRYVFDDLYEESFTKAAWSDMYYGEDYEDISEYVVEAIESMDAI